MDPDRSAQGRDPHTQYDLRHIFLSVGRAILEHLITRTALGCDLEARRSAQRFERDTYHGDALPTELRGLVFSCLTWGFAPPSGQLRSCTPVLRGYPLRALESLPYLRNRGVFTSRRPASRPAPPGPARTTAHGSPRSRRPRDAHRRPQHPP